MMRRFLSVLLAVILSVTSLDMMVYADEMRKYEADHIQEVDMLNEIVQADKMWVAEDVELTKDVEIVKGTKTSERIQEESQKETVLESTDEVNSKKASMEVTEETVEKE